MISRALLPSLLALLGLSAAAGSAAAQPKAPPQPPVPAQVAASGDEDPESPPPSPRPARAADLDAAQDAPATPPAAPAVTAPAAPVAVAPEFSAKPAGDTVEEPDKAPPRQHFTAGIGFKAGVVEGAGFDPYSRDNTLPAASLFGTYTPWDTRPFSIHLGFEWDYGGSTATARSFKSSMNVHRLALGLEGRYMPITRMRLFVRALPSLMHADAVIDDASFEHKLGASAWTWGVDLTAGAAARIGSIGANEHPNVSFWLGLDMGYRFAGVASLRMRPGELTDLDQTRRFGDIKLTDLDLSGFISRASFSIAF